MKTVFCDTSGFYALLLGSDKAHPRAALAWEKLLEGEYRLTTTNYVALEAITLTQMRYGLDSARRVRALFKDCIDVHVLPATIHERAIDDVFHYDQRSLSLVDCSSFIFMRHHSIDIAFAYDHHFEKYGFTLFA